MLAHRIGIADSITMALSFFVSSYYVFSFQQGVDSGWYIYGKQKTIIQKEVDYEKTPVYYIIGNSIMLIFIGMHKTICWENSQLQLLLLVYCL